MLGIDPVQLLREIPSRGLHGPPGKQKSQETEGGEELADRWSEESIATLSLRRL